jgi:hypothetical protein
MHSNDDDQVEIDNKKMLVELKKQDRGFAQISGYKQRSNGSFKQSKIDIYTSGFSGNYIRNAETGDYFKHIVGSLDEDLYFKVIIATGECKSKNNSNILFYTSPEHYMRHLNINLSQDVIFKWEKKRNSRLLYNSQFSEKSRSSKSVVVK